MEVDRYNKARWRERFSEAFAFYVLVKPFKWAAQGVILLDNKVNNVLEKRVYGPGCAGIAVPQYLVRKAMMKPSRTVPFTLSSYDGVTTIRREVFDSLVGKWKETEMKWPAVALPGAGLKS